MSTWLARRTGELVFDRIFLDGYLAFPFSPGSTCPQWSAGTSAGLAQAVAALWTVGSAFRQRSGLSLGLD